MTQASILSILTFQLQAREKKEVCKNTPRAMSKYEHDTVGADEVVVDRSNQQSEGIGVEYSIPSNIALLDLTHNRLKAITNVSGLAQLHTLILRQNLLTEVSGLDELPSLRKLDLYDNQIEVIGSSSLSSLRGLLYLDVSFNQLRKLENLENLVQLEELYACSNKITEMSGLEALVNLRTLELGSNRIREIGGLDTLVQLRALWLGRNKIAQVRNLEPVANSLRVLSLQANRLRTIHGLDALVNLEELYLGENGIQRIENLGALTKLRVIDLSNNLIETIGDSLAHLPALAELWLNQNRIAEYREIEPLASIASLRIVYLEMNPFCAEDTAYKNKVIHTLLQIEQLDADDVPNRHVPTAS